MPHLLLDAMLTNAENAYIPSARDHPGVAPQFSHVPKERIEVGPPKEDG